MNSSETPFDTVLESAKVREVTGVFHSRDALRKAADDLLLAGFDRSDIDVIGGPDEILQKFGPVYVATEELADLKQAPRRPLFMREDITVANVVVASSAGAVCGVATAYFTLNSGLSDVAAGITAALVGLCCAAIAFLLMAMRFRRSESEELSAYMETRGLVLWVRVRAPEQEHMAQEILLRNGGRAVRVHEIERDKRTEDLPFSSFRPDPWLGSEPLGHP